MSNPKKLKELIRRDGIAVLPGAQDALGARMIEGAGFGGAFLTGGGMHATYLACSDMDFLSLGDLVDQTRRMCQAVDIPIVVDAEEGFGGVPNVIRTVQMFEEAGAAGLHLDDEVSPGKCPFLHPGVRQELISIDDMCEKIQAAVAARKDKDFLIIARCDTLGSTYDTGDNSHLEEQIKRLKAYAAAGADCVFPVAITYDDYKRVLDSVDAPFKICCVSPQIANIPGYDLHKHTPEDFLKDMGCNLMIAPLFTVTAYMKAMKETLDEFKQTGIQPGDKMFTFAQYNETVALRYHQLHGYV